MKIWTNIGSFLDFVSEYQNLKAHLVETGCRVKCPVEQNVLKDHKNCDKSIIWITNQIY